MFICYQVKTFYLVAKESWDCLNAPSHRSPLPYPASYAFLYLLAALLNNSLEKQGTKDYTDVLLKNKKKKKYETTKLKKLENYKILCTFQINFYAAAFNQAFIMFIYSKLFLYL